MDSEFRNIELNKIRYSIVWEDYQSLYQGLEIKASDELLIITSAGCNVLNALLKSPKKIIAIDINPYQNKLLRFKLQLYKHSDFETMSVLLGIDKTTSCIDAFNRVKEFFTDEECKAWERYFIENPDGLLTNGHLEKYIHRFYSTLNENEQEYIDKLFQSTNLNDHHKIFNDLITTTSFENKFKEYFSDEQLSKGRDPKLFKYADENGGNAFYQRLCNYVQKRLLKDNFYMYFFFYGLKNIDPNILPPCYRAENFESIKINLDNIEIQTADVIDYIEDNISQKINKTSLSNIFEYTSTEEFEETIQKIKSKSSIETILFWNLLHEQSIIPPSKHLINTNKSEAISQSESCFYFKNVRVLNL